MLWKNSMLRSWRSVSRKKRRPKLTKNQSKNDRIHSSNHLYNNIWEVIKIKVLGKSSLRQYLVDNHIWNSDIHLTCMTDVCAIKVYQFTFQYFFSLVNSWVFSNFDHSVVDLSYIYLVNYFICCFSTGTAIFAFMACELSSVRGSIEYVEDVSEHWSAWHLYPVQSFASIKQSIMCCLRLISSSISSKFFNISNCIDCISKILMLDYTWIPMVSICNNCKSQSDSFSSYFILYSFNNSNNCRLNLSELAAHWSCRVNAEADIYESEGRQR